MINLVILLLLFAFSICIFFIENYIVLASISLIIFAMLFIFKISLKSILIYTKSVLPFVLLAAFINFFLGGRELAILTGIRFLLACYAVIAYRQKSSPMQLANAIETLCMPLKVFKLKPSDIGLMVCIAITFIPILLRDFNSIKNALQSKGLKLRPGNMNYLLKPFVIGIFNRTNEITNALKSKAYS
ncbi:energy-coupling factor transporter transmembrane protein EcfT [Spirochaetia bacterium]|nr:energy-coupling factor transporter transmembrane protein EcfT [Spirochaetia bacterium]